jgi:K+-transporting ATPase KdpF subunit
MGLELPAFPRRSSRFAPSAPQSSPGGPMTVTGLVVAVALVLYLVAALIFPERF